MFMSNFAPGYVICNPPHPVFLTPIQNSFISKHRSYETDSIFDKFQCCFSGDGNNFASGSYQSLFHVYDRNSKVCPCCLLHELITLTPYFSRIRAMKQTQRARKRSLCRKSASFLDVAGAAVLT
jgi:hypothetical protein